MLDAILYIIRIVAYIYGFVLTCAIVLSWIPNAYSNRLLRVPIIMANWYLNLFRYRVVIGIFDVGTIIGLVIYNFIIQFAFII